MKIFITGIAGFLGSHLADLMISEGHTVAGNDNMIGGYADNVPQNVEFHQVDCCDLENMTKAMEGCDIVYHTFSCACHKEHIRSISHNYYSGYKEQG
jgi:UDP-glucose 4-epimerase